MLNFYDALKRWQEIRQEIEQLQEEESNLRMGIFAAAFPKPREGTNTYKLPNNMVLKGTYKYVRSIIPDKLKEVDLMLEAVNSESRSRDFVSWNPALSLASYRQAPAEVRAIMDRAIQIKPAKPVLTVEAKE